MFTVAPDRRTARLLHHLASEEGWERRSTAVLTEFTRRAAESVMWLALARIPKSNEWAEYAQSLQLVRVGSRPIFAVRANPVLNKPQRVDADRSVLYVRRLKKWNGKKHPEIDVLEKFNPWTAATLPFRPDAREAKVVSRKVSARETRAVAKKRKLDRLKWRQELRRCGVKLQTRREEQNEQEGLAATPDLGFNVLRLEFGLGGLKAAPHWRPSIYSVVSSIPKMLAGSDFRRTMLDPSFAAWRSWPGPYAVTISESEAAKYDEFQKRLGVKV